MQGSLPMAAASEHGDPLRPTAGLFWEADSYQRLPLLGRRAFGKILIRQVSRPSLRQVRIQRLLTIRELACQADVAVSTIYLIEAGRTRPLFRVIRQIAAALNVEPNHVDEFRQVMEAFVAREHSRRWSRASNNPPPDHGVPAP